MNRSFEYMTNLQYEVKYLRALVADFQSGETYVRMEKEHRRIVAAKDREIRRLKAEIAASHAQTVDVRNKWFQACVDVEKEKEAALTAKDREVKRAMAELYKAQRQRDEALDRLREKNLELYEVKTQLEEEKGKNQELTARTSPSWEKKAGPHPDR